MYERITGKCAGILFSNMTELSANKISKHTYANNKKSPATKTEHVCDMQKSKSQKNSKNTVKIL